MTTDLRQIHRYRVAHRLHICLATLLRTTVRDARLRQQLQLTTVVLSPDLENATVYFLCDDDKQQELRPLLQKVSGFLRSTVARRLSLKRMPTLRFVFDESVRRGDNVGHLLDSLEVIPTVAEPTP